MSNSMQKALFFFLIVLAIAGAAFAGFTAYMTFADEGGHKTSSASYVSEEKARQICDEYLKEHYNLTDSSMLKITINGNDSEVYCVTYNYIRKSGRIEPVFVLTVNKFTGNIGNCVEESGYFYIVRRLKERSDQTEEAINEKMQ